MYVDPLWRQGLTLHAHIDSLTSCWVIDSLCTCWLIVISSACRVVVCTFLLVSLSVRGLWWLSVVVAWRSRCCCSSWPGLGLCFRHFWISVLIVRPCCGGWLSVGGWSCWKLFNCWCFCVYKSCDFKTPETSKQPVKTVKPLTRKTPTRKMWATGFRGTGTGWPGIPQGYPWYSLLCALLLVNSTFFTITYSLLLVHFQWLLLILNSTCFTITCSLFLIHFWCKGAPKKNFLTWGRFFL